MRFRAQTIVRSRKVIRPQILFYNVVYLDRPRFWLPLCFLMQSVILAGLVRVRVAAGPTLPLFHHGLRVRFLCRHLRGNHSLWRNFGFLRQFGYVLVLSCLHFIGLFLLICPGRNDRTLLWIIATMYYLFGWSPLMSLWHDSPPLVFYSFRLSLCTFTFLQRIHSRTRSVTVCESPSVHPLTKHHLVRSARREHVHGPLLAAHLLVYSHVERIRQGKSFS